MCGAGAVNEQRFGEVTEALCLLEQVGLFRSKANAVVVLAALVVQHSSKESCHWAMELSLTLRFDSLEPKKPQALLALHWKIWQRGQISLHEVGIFAWCLGGGLIVILAYANNGKAIEIVEMYGHLIGDPYLQKASLRL